MIYAIGAKRQLWLIALGRYGHLRIVPSTFIARPFSRAEVADDRVSLDSQQAKIARVEHAKPAAEAGGKNWRREGMQPPVLRSRN
jgi:hypothetical protein